MALNHSPSIVTNGLVFAYDMTNTKKSFMGAPTTNLLTYSESPSTVYNRYLGTFGATVLSPINTLTATALNVTAGAGATWDFYRNVAVTSGVVYTVSMYVKLGTATNFCLVINNSLAWNTIGGRCFTSADGLSQNSWVRVSYTFTAVASGVIHMHIGANIETALLATPQSTGTVYMWGTQLEVGSFATPYISTTSTVGTRSNTQALKDLTGNNTITATSLTYSSDNTFSFNGTNQIVVPNIDFSIAQTIEIWLKPTENDAVRRNPYNQAYGGYGTWTHETSGIFNLYYGDAGSNTTPYIGHSSSFTVAQNEVACVCSTRDITQSIWYKNGALGGSYAHSYGTLLTDINQILIGTGYADGYIGNIYSVKLYNRALSAAEVSKNFNALRGRFGI